MKKAYVVIGANYGDEGKGLITDYLAAQEKSDVRVVRFNGGAQAGHTVQRPNGIRHVFSHFSSGTFANAETYLSEFFIANPILFKQELAKLTALGLSPKITAHPKSIITTPYDMYINQLVEITLDKARHGSCGVGINETVERNLHSNYQLTMKDLVDKAKLKKRLRIIRDQWMPFRLKSLLKRDLTADEKELIFAEEIFEYFVEDVQTFYDYCDIADYQYLDDRKSLIFEGAQGLLLDQRAPDFPHVTRSNTGVENVAMIADFCNISHLDIHYVTRCYLTRHGAGPLPNECAVCPCPYFSDATNLPHKFQGTLRFAPLNVKQLNVAIDTDLHKLSKSISKNVTLAVTCLDQFSESLVIAEENGKLTELSKQQFLEYLVGNTEFDQYILSHGPTREDCKLIDLRVSA